MKKLFFSAVALVAFSSVSMASTIVESETKSENPIVTEIDCVQVAIAALEAADPNNEMTAVQAHNFYQAQYIACENSKKNLGIN